MTSRSRLGMHEMFDAEIVDILVPSAYSAFKTLFFLFSSYDLFVIVGNVLRFVFVVNMNRCMINLSLSIGVTRVVLSARCTNHRTICFCRYNMNPCTIYDLRVVRIVLRFVQVVVITRKIILSL